MKRHGTQERLLQRGKVRMGQVVPVSTQQTA